MVGFAGSAHRADPIVREITPFNTLFSLAVNRITDHAFINSHFPLSKNPLAVYTPSIRVPSSL
jgi:hypothetical protein